MSIREPIKLKDLLEEGAVFDVDLEKSRQIDKDVDDEAGYNEALANFANFQVLGEGFNDEDLYVEGQPFEKIASRMISIVENEAIKKRIIREGYGNRPPNKSLVKVHYNAYVEYSAEPSIPPMLGGNHTNLILTVARLL
ncbi:hypothetical protein NQ317_009361 [Molorchus minor]|uniref:DNA-directed RNA polymerase n=1 Tax=Molorchus minor TaxID=1323400 RepID=A0ABQ9JL90_9CUCU|nr:hypothetical protein NQ317_009361 [Molorchus minor]